jgi:hypothetical protein
VPESVVVEWWEEGDAGCTRFSQQLPDGSPIAGPALGGSCELTGLATGPDGSTVILRGALSLDLLSAEAPPRPLPLPEGWPRAVAFGPDGSALVLTADDAGPATDEGAPFRVVTWRLEAQDTWRRVEEVVTPPLRTVRAVEGGPVWRSRLPGSTADRWVLESAPGFALALDLKVPKRVRPPEAVAWGRVPLGDDAELVVRYGMLGVPLPAGPLLVRRGRSWSTLDDSHFLETPVSVEQRGAWLAFSYEGWSPQLVDLTTGRALWSDEQRSARSAPRLVSGTPAP